MLLRCKCPSCGETKEYIGEQVGSTLDCFRCGHRFELGADGLDVRVHRAVVARLGLVPRMLQDVVAGEDPAGP